MLFRILVYIDQTTRGQWSLTLSKEIVSGMDAGVILLTTEENHQKAPDLLESTAAEITAATGRDVTTRVRPGPPREAILKESHASSPAITIFPPAGRSSLARMFKGSRVRTVVHNSPSTVMVARQPVSDSIRHVLVSVSGGPMSQTTLLSAHEVVQALDSELTVLHVKSSVVLPNSAPAEKPEKREAEVPEIPKLLAQLPWHEGKEPKLEIREGMVVREILEECQRGHYDLLILGQHLATKDSGGPLSQNLAELLAMESPIPVLIVRPRRWATGVKLREETQEH